MAARNQIVESNVVKIIQCITDLYADALKLMQLNRQKSIWPKEWIPLVVCKRASFLAVAEYYRAKACGSREECGEQIAHLKKATELMKIASSLAGSQFIYRTEEEMIKKDLETILKRNIAVNDASSSDAVSLSSIFKTVLSVELEHKDFKDIFVKIVPLAQVSNLTFYAEISRLINASQSLGEALGSRNLPADLGDRKDETVVDMIMAGSVALRNKGGYSKINGMWQGLRDVINRNHEKLNEDKDKFTSKFTSLKEKSAYRHNKAIVEKLAQTCQVKTNYLDNLTQYAKTEYDAIRKIYKEHSHKIRILSQNDAALRQSIRESLDPHNIQKKVRPIYEKIQSMEATRSVLIVEIGSYAERNFDKNQDDIDNELELFQMHVEQSLKEQDDLLSELEESYTELGDSDSNSHGRVEVIDGLMLAIDKYDELVNILDEGVIFFGDLTEILFTSNNVPSSSITASKTTDRKRPAESFSAIDNQVSKSSNGKQTPLSLQPRQHGSSNPKKPCH